VCLSRRLNPVERAGPIVGQRVDMNIDRALDDGRSRIAGLSSL
jgi:hypothetical protein